MANDLQRKDDFTTALSQWTNTFTGLVQRDFGECGVEYDPYSAQCAMAAMTGIYTLVKDSGKDPNSIDKDSIRQAVGQCASLKLNANAVPAECYFQLRYKNIGEKGKAKWVTVVETGIMGSGTDSMLRNFGNGVEEVYPTWIVHQGDEFIYPRMRGIEVQPPEWSPQGVSDKVDKVVCPVKLNGIVQYFIAERESAKVNLFAHIRNALMNETFGICGKRYDATPEQQAEIKARKQVIYDALSACDTLDEMLSCELARPYISAAWTDSTESMVARKLQSNATRKIPKNYNTLAKKSYTQLDEVYKASREEIEENQNSEVFIEIPEEEVVE